MTIYSIQAENNYVANLDQFCDRLINGDLIHFSKGEREKAVFTTLGEIAEQAEEKYHFSHDQKQSLIYKLKDVAESYSIDIYELQYEWS